ncbi:MAG TPA: AIR synthase-related protein, partial [bacterium]|nr:AIR synthase-related protein [bacterium]
TQRNRGSLGGAVSWEGIEEEARVLLSDAQTSGGLLMAVPEERVDRLVRALRDRAVPAAAVVGEIVGPGRGEITVTPR